MVSFEPSDDQRALRDAVAEFAKSKVRPRTREIEGARGLPNDLCGALVDLGVGGMSIAQAHGGGGSDFVSLALVEEALAYADAGVAFSQPGPAWFAHAIAELADDAQQARFLAPFVQDGALRGAVAFSEARPCVARPGFNATARRDDDRWVLEGEKAYVLHAGEASHYVVFAQVDASAGWDGIGAFVVASGAPGLTFGQRSRTLGLDAATFGSLKLAGVVVAEGDRLGGRGDFRAALLRFFSRQSVIVAARAVGVAQAAWDLARDFADERRAFGKPIGHFQAIAFLLADRLIDIDGARLLVHRAAWSLDGHGDAAARLARSAEAVAEGLEVVLRVTADALQIHGGAGFVRDYLVEKLMRDGKQLQLCAPTSTTSDQLFSAIALGAPLDPALVLPTPEIQPIFT